MYSDECVHYQQAVDEYVKFVADHHRKLEELEELELKAYNALPMHSWQQQPRSVTDVGDGNETLRARSRSPPRASVLPATDGASSVITFAESYKPTPGLKLIIRDGKRKFI